MSRRIFTGALSDEIAAAEGRADDRERIALLHDAAKGILDLIREGLIRDGAVRLHQFGTFRLKPVAARKGINPRTGAPLVIPAHRRVVFTPAKALLDRIEPVHPAPLPLPAAEPAPEAVAVGAARPAPPAPIAPAPEPVIGIPQPETPPEPRRPEHRWMAAAALLAALAVLVILLLPSPDQPGVDTVVVTEPQRAPSATDTGRPEPHSRAPADSGTAPERHALASGPGTTTLPTEKTPAAQATDGEPAAASAAPARDLPTPSARDQRPGEDDRPSEPSPAAAPETVAAAPEPPSAAAGATHSGSEAADRNGPGATVESTTDERDAAPLAAAAPPDTGASVPTASPAPPEPIPPQPYFSARAYQVVAGDNLWHLSDRHYEEPILWPHIYRANHPRVDDPDLIYIGDVLTLPELQGPPTDLSARDREQIAEGYYLVYRRYEAQRHPDAIYALIGVRWFDPAVYERHRNDLSRQRLRIMELSPLHGDRVPRLLAATFKPSRQRPGNPEMD